MTVEPDHVVERWQAPWLETTPRVDREWQPMTCPGCGETLHDTTDLGLLHKRDARCHNESCPRYRQTYTYGDYRGLTDVQRAELATQGIFV